jgi:catechol 2,3-dioxygenase-like lactoylglutathione lyase family enzyme
MPTITPMLHVPDIPATIAWYASIGFHVIDTAEGEGEMTWAMLAYGEARVMFDCGGRASDAPRREADLYVEVEGVDGLFATLPQGVDVFEGPHDTFYGMREFIVRDNNGFWLTFGEPIARA